MVTHSSTPLQRMDLVVIRLRRSAIALRVTLGSLHIRCHHPFIR